MKKGVEWIHHVLHLLLWFNYADRQGINRNVHVGTLTNGLNCNCLQITGREHQYWHRRAVGAQRQSMRGLSGLSRWRAPASCLTNISSLHIHRKIIVLKNINSNFYRVFHSRAAELFVTVMSNPIWICWVVFKWVSKVSYFPLEDNGWKAKLVLSELMSLFANSSSLLWRAH